MKLSMISLLIMVAQLNLFGNTDSKFLDWNNFEQQIRNYEIVAPRLQIQGLWRREISTRSSLGDHIDKAVFFFRGFGKNFVLVVAQNRVLLPVNYVSRSFSADGAEVISGHEKTDNCFYQGTVQGLQHSVVAISTCHGIEGMVYDGNETYFIQPLPGNTEQHILFRSKDMVQGEKRCGVDHFKVALDMEKDILNGQHRVRRNLKNEIKYVELIIVNDHSQFLKLRSIAEVEKRSKSIANIVDSLFRAINVRVALIMVETWNRRDRIEVVEDSNTCLDNFMVYRNGDLWKKQKHDNAMLITHRSFKGSTVGKAALMSMCGRKSGGVVRDHATNAAATAATVAHEMGHNFGMLHDEDIESCKCNSPSDNQGCIMSAVAKGTPSTEWSSCSRESYEKYLNRGMDSCLFNVPQSLFGDAVCGNGFKEEGEECDCGSVEDCKKYSDGCCNATTCKLHPDSECDTGACCSKCKLKPQGVVCREKLNECDLPEFCTGKSELCPSNKYVQNGRSCANNNGYCYNGECPTHDKQCKDLWGHEAKSGPDVCYKVNEQGTVRGNCHQPGNNVYIKCTQQNRLCGMLQCTNIDKIELPIIGSDKSSYAHSFGGILCKSTSLSLGRDVPDPGMTVEGTKCGENKLCLDRKCMSVDSLTTTVKRCPNNCSNDNGICNNEGECFCLSCWQGADCSQWVNCGQEGGNGTNQTYVVTPTTANNTETTVVFQGSRESSGTVAAVVVVCILLLVGVALGVIYRKRLMQKWRACQLKAPGPKRYQGVPHGSSEQNNERSRPETRSDLDVEAAKARPNISGPTLNSTTRNGSDLTLKRNTLSSTSTSKEPAKQDKPDREPLIALKPTPKIPNKQVEAKWETSTKYPPPNLRTREWPRKDEKDSLNRVSSPTEISKPVNPIKSSRPKSHAGILDKPAVPPPPSRKEPLKPPKPRRPESLAGLVDKHEPAKPFKPRRPESHAGVIDKPEAGKRAKPRRPESHAGVLDKPASPSWKKPLPPSAAGEKKSEMTGASNPPASAPKVPVRPPLRPVEARLRRQSSEERPTSLPLKPSDLKKAGVATAIKKPASFSKADKKVALRPPGPIPPRPGTKPT
ncbi:zinc metalloproteinase-disintegrin-like berythractivase isoform X2 [Acropora millepora]|uniref:zinc metalloproteinase-disintegrin-like berythractivase isoform X2 n=1 Tax=Acropora millepora TaxID=45264 RepID=UPI001CF4F4DC|nr:zinc metalloproteinase-disintegrin-like berythractivase isoform X2 [Acropora millepora]